MIYFLTAVIAVATLLITINSVIRNSLLPKYAILWVAYSVILVIFSANPKLIDKLAQTFGVYYSPSMLFVLCILFLMLYAFHLSIVATKLNGRVITLVQEVGILNNKVDKIIKKVGMMNE